MHVWLPQGRLIVGMVVSSQSRRTALKIRVAVRRVEHTVASPRDAIFLPSPPRTPGGIKNQHGS
jgi:hypothetical protein